MQIDSFSTTDANDGGGQISGVSYGAAQTTFSANGDGTDMLAAKSMVSASDFRTNNALMRWDVSSISASAKVIGATIRVWCIDSDKDGTEAYNLIADYYDFGGEATVIGDITNSATGNIIIPVALPTLPIGELKTYTVTDLSGIQSAVGVGFVGVRFKLSIDAAPTANNNYVHMAPSEHATHPAPELRVTYVFDDPVEADLSRFPKHKLQRTS